MRKVFLNLVLYSRQIYNIFELITIFVILFLFFASSNFYCLGLIATLSVILLPSFLWGFDLTNFDSRQNMY